MKTKVKINWSPDEPGSWFAEINGKHDTYYIQKIGREYALIFMPPNRLNATQHQILKRGTKAECKEFAQVHYQSMNADN